MMMTTVVWCEEHNNSIIEGVELCGISILEWKESRRADACRIEKRPLGEPGDILAPKGSLVIPTPWPDWVTARIPVKDLEWAWLHSKLEPDALSVQSELNENRSLG